MKIGRTSPGFFFFLIVLPNEYYFVSLLSKGVSMRRQQKSCRFNGKELDEETGLYYFGARYYNPKYVLWYGTDPLQEKYPWVSSYCYTIGNPICFVDLIGFEPTEEEAARMADYVYNNGKVKLIGGWRPSDKTLKNVTISSQESGFKSLLFEKISNTGQLEYVYAFAGTDGFDLKDWKNNFQQLIGTSRQYIIAMKNADHLSKQIEGDLTFVGHSLGGGLAAASAYKTGGRAITFNAAGVSPFTIQHNKNAKIDAYLMVNDELHLIQHNLGLPIADGKKHWRINPLGGFGHPIKNFHKAFTFKL